MRTLGLLFATSLAIALPLHANAAGCQYDMQCKGERICQKGECVAPDDDDQATTDQPAKPPAPRAAPASRATSAPAATPVPASARMAKNPPPDPDPHFCCTVAGRLKPYGTLPSDIVVGDACQGMTNSGKPVPGTACQ